MNNNKNMNYSDLYIKELEFKARLFDEITRIYTSLPLKKRIELEQNYLRKEYEKTKTIDEYGSFFYPEIYNNEISNSIDKKSINKIEKQDLIKTIEAITNEDFVITSMEHKKVKLDEVVSKYNEIFHKNASRANIKYYTNKYELNNVIDLNSDYNAMKRLSKEQIIEMIELFDHKPTIKEITEYYLSTLDKEAEDYRENYVSKENMRNYINGYELNDMIKTCNHTESFKNKKQ